MGKFINMKGKKFGYWEVKEYIGEGKWLCLCECGSLKKVSGSTLRNKTSTNCGCKNIKHGCEGTKIYRLWSYMKERCYSENHKSYKNYGGRGIKVCDEWLEAKTFIEWCFKNGYEEGLSLDRIDVNGNYEPNNCRFITIKEQQRNKRNSKFIEINGVTKVASEWAELAGLDRQTIYYRIKKGEKGIMLLRKGRKGGGWSEGDIKKYFNKTC